MWIETGIPYTLSMADFRSRLMQACGLKHILESCLKHLKIVTPHAGVWIETSFFLNQIGGVIVTPHAGVWIETMPFNSLLNTKLGHASCRRVD